MQPPATELSSTFGAVREILELASHAKLTLPFFFYYFVAVVVRVASERATSVRSYGSVATSRPILDSNFTS